METVLAWACLIALIGGYIAYGRWLTAGIKPRVFETAVPAERLRDLFVVKVARAGWKVVDDGNPLVAQSSLATGIRQQIGLDVRSTANGRNRVEVGPERWVTKRGVPKKGHTIRMRLNAFVAAVQAEDQGIDVRVKELRGR